MPPDLSRASPTGTTNNVLSNPVLSESPGVTPQSTLVAESSVLSGSVGNDNTISPLRLDDIQSAIPLDDAFENNEGEYMRSSLLPQHYSKTMID